jgi:hypothetical protein
VVAKDIHTTCPPILAPGLGGTPLLSRTGTLKAESSAGSEDDIGRMGRDVKDGSRSDFASKADNNADNLFVEDVSRFICSIFSPTSFY